MVAHLYWVTWAIGSQLLISSEQPEQIAHSRSFDLSKVSEWVMSKWAKSQPWNFLRYCDKQLKQYLFFSLFKSKTEEKLKQSIFPLYASKTVLPIFGHWNKKRTNFNFNLIFAYCYFMHKESLSKLSKRNLIYKVPMISKTLPRMWRMCSKSHPCFWIKLLTKYLIEENVAFLKKLKSAKLLHPTLQSTIFCIAYFLSLNYTIGIFVFDRHSKQFSNRDSNLIY